MCVAYANNQKIGGRNRIIHYDILLSLHQLLLLSLNRPESDNFIIMIASDCQSVSYKK